MISNIKNILQKIPFGALSIACLLITYFVASTIGMLVIPVILCIIFILPLGVIFAVLDIVIRKKKLVPIICLIASLYPIVGFTIIMFNMISGFITTLI